MLHELADHIHRTNMAYQQQDKMTLTHRLKFSEEVRLTE